MSHAGWFATIEGGALGALKQAINIATGSVRLPISALPDAPIGDVLEPVGDEQRAGADLLDDVARWLGIGHRRPNAQALRLARPLLATYDQLVERDGAAVRLSFDATATGIDWGRAGHESTVVAIYVDGRYHSSVVVLAERDGSYSVNLGELRAGRHRIEVRSAAALAGPAAAVAGVSNLRGDVLDGDAALIARHAPMLQMRDDLHDPRLAAAHNDTPLQIVPVVTPRPDGGRRIDYRVVFSNEDGGTHLDRLLSHYGRGIDSEIVYSVELDRNGAVLAETYQSPVHATRRFDGRREAGRPVLRVSSANNMVSARTDAVGGAERWSEAPVAPVGPDNADLDILRATPWIAAVMGKEMLREHRVDARRFVYIGALDDAARAGLVAAGGVALTLRDGRRIQARISTDNIASGNRCTALQLPGGVTADMVVGAELLGTHAFVLDAAFGIRELVLSPRHDPARAATMRRLPV